MKSSQEHTDVARALSAALEPLIDVCLTIGVTSPEFESLLRAAFVQRAFVKLPRHSRTGRGPSDSRVSLAAGVHRSEVSRIRAAGGTAGAKGTMEKEATPVFQERARLDGVDHGSALYDERRATLGPADGAQPAAS